MKTFPKKYSNALMVIIVAIAVKAISFDAPSIKVILVTQVGVLKILIPP